MKRLQSLLIISMLGLSANAHAMDSYRFLHVTIDTPWAIFLFLLPIVLSPFIIMAILYWKYAGRKPDNASSKQDSLEQE